MKEGRKERKERKGESEGREGKIKRRNIYLPTGKAIEMGN